MFHVTLRLIDFIVTGPLWRPLGPVLPSLRRPPHVRDHHPDAGRLLSHSARKLLALHCPGRHRRGRRVCQPQLCRRSPPAPPHLPAAPHPPASRTQTRTRPSQTTMPQTSAQALPSRPLISTRTCIRTREEGHPEMMLPSFPSTPS